MGRTLACFLFLAIASLVSGCDDPDPSDPAADPATIDPTATPSVPTLRERSDDARESGAAQAIELTASDGVVIHGTFRAGGAANAPAVVLVHQLGATRDEWAPVIAELSRAPGMTTLAIDMRGHGDSIVGPDGAALSQHAFDTAEWEKTALDVRAALAHLAADALVAPRALAVVGSSIGSSAAIAAAADDPRVRAVVALSPGRAYRGFDALTPASRLRDRAVLLLAAEGEAPAVETVDAIAAMNPRAERAILAGAAHGLAMRADNPDLATRIDTFLRTALAQDTDDH